MALLSRQQTSFAIWSAGQTFVLNPTASQKAGSVNESQPDPFAFCKGPRDAKILFVGESWGEEEARQQKPFVGGSGMELDRMLLESGINPSSILFTNVFNLQPQGNDAWTFFQLNSTNAMLYRGLRPTPFVMSELQKLHTLLRTVQPALVIAAGNYALWATTDCCSTSSLSIGNGATVLVPGGITSWRGSMLESNTVEGMSKLKVLPLIHPAAIMRAWYQRAVTIHDLRTRVPSALSNLWRPSPGPHILAPPTFAQAMDALRMWKSALDAGQRLRLSHDIETALRCITCMSLSTGHYDSSGFALVLPLIRPERKTWINFWTESEEFNLLSLVREILSHPNVQVEGQNYLYDTQYMEDQYFVTPRLDFDTMLAHHLLFPGTPKGLDYLSSLYCRFHWYWKEDLKEWDNTIDWEKNLEYNAEDALRTGECATHLRQMILDQGMQELWEWEKRKNALALEMMRRGVAIDRRHRARLAFELSAAREERRSWLASIIPQTWLVPHLKTSKSNWWASVAQQKILFYDLLGCKGQINRKTGRPTINFEALQELKQKNPELSRIFDAMIDDRSIGVYHSTFIEAELEPQYPPSPDVGRLKCSFNPPGTSTFRWSSSTNAFGRGTNLQNIPVGEEE